jgi:hypothetical protein
MRNTNTWKITVPITMEQGAVVTAALNRYRSEMRAMLVSRPTRAEQLAVEEQIAAVDAVLRAIRDELGI